MRTRPSTWRRLCSCTRTRRRCCRCCRRTCRRRPLAWSCSSCRRRSASDLRAHQHHQQRRRRRHPGRAQLRPLVPSPSPPHPLPVPPLPFPSPIQSLSFAMVVHDITRALFLPTAGPLSSVLVLGRLHRLHAGNVAVRGDVREGAWWSVGRHGRARRAACSIHAQLPTTYSSYRHFSYVCRSWWHFHGM